MLRVRPEYRNCRVYTKTKSGKEIDMANLNDDDVEKLLSAAPFMFEEVAECANCGSTLSEGSEVLCDECYDEDTGND